MKSYTVKRIAAELSIDAGAASTIRRIVRLEMDRDAIYTASPSTEHWAEVECYNRPGMGAVRMHAINYLMGGCGVEGIEKPDSHGDGRHSDYIDYVNTGDSYNATVLRDGGRYWVGTWGDTVERMGRLTPA